MKEIKLYNEIFIVCSMLISGAFIFIFNYYITFAKQVEDKKLRLKVALGQYIAYLDGKEATLGPGDELFIPKGTEQWGKCIAGTRTIHAFGGKRIVKNREFRV